METNHLDKWGNQLERSSWTLVFFGMMTQVSTEYAFPSYNVALGFWGAHCAFSCHGRSTFGLLSFLLLGCILDVTFFFTNSNDSPIFKFQVVMLVFCLLAKAYGLFCGSHFFAAVGGAYSMDPSQARNRANVGRPKSSGEANMSMGMMGMTSAPDGRAAGGGAYARVQE